MNVLLVEPNYYTKYPPLGLLKLASYHKSKGDCVELIRAKYGGLRMPAIKPDRIYITSLFTWAWRPVWDAVRFYKERFPHTEIWLGGIYASLLPEHAEMSGADLIIRGFIKEIEDLMPDYSLVPDWDGSIVFSSRGCNRECGFCAIPRIEGKINSVKHSIKHLVWPNHTRIIFWDNNILQSPSWRNIFNELHEMNLKVDFNQGLDARLITDEVAENLNKIKLDSWIKLGYDQSSERFFVKRAIERLKAVGIRGRRIMVYTLFNYTDDPEDFFQRVRDLLSWGVVTYPMRYEPIYTLEKNKYISPRWDANKIEMVQKARRVIGYGGSFPPYEGLVKKFEKAKGFEDAFSLRPPRGQKS